MSFLDLPATRQIPNGLQFPDDPTLDQSPDVSVPLPDGSIDVYIAGDGEPEPDEDAAPSMHGENLAELIDRSDLSLIATELLQGIEQDDSSRSELLDAIADGIKLLALKPPKADAAGVGGAGTSTVDHPLLLEALLRFHANASGELMPVDGPVKIRDDNQTPTESEYADALEIDANHYLTVTASEWQDDTDRALIWCGFVGSSFKKVYHCPLRRRPVSETVTAQDLIVSNDSTDLQNAGRVTQCIKMRPAVIKRMQLLGAYRDVELYEASSEVEQNVVAEAVDESAGVDVSEVRPEDRQRDLYESYCELDIPGYEHKEDGKVTGLPLPYKVTIDKESREILEIRRNWREDDEDQRAKQVFVQYKFWPGLSFYGVGLLQILGNTTNALSASWRMMLDAGMFANFPGFLYKKGLGRQNTLDMRVAPGSGFPIDCDGPIDQSVMPLPYKGVNEGLAQLTENVAQVGQRLGGTAELNVGEGRQDAPVGTTVALIEQATKVMDAVHKRLCRAQGREFELLFDLFREDPEAFWRSNRKPQMQWDEATLLTALDDVDLVPVADPNTSSHTARLGKAAALVQMAEKAPPGIFDIAEIADYATSMIRLPNYKRFLLPKQAPGASAPDPKLLQAQAALQSAQTDQAELAFNVQNSQVEDQNRDKDRQAKLDMTRMNLQKEVVIHQAKVQADQAQQTQKLASDHVLQQRDQAHNAAVTQAGLAQAAISGQQQHAHDASMQQRDMIHEQHLAAGGAVRDVIAGHVDHVRAAHEQAREHGHNLVAKALDIAHEQRMKGADLAHEREMAEAGHDNAVELAKLKPKPRPKSDA